ncbi:MAG: BBE domain-containing protein [Burkholderiales bacterium]
MAEVKGRYDPDNVFHLNQNIKPVGLKGTVEKAA